jgi:N4-gp56 family major capsid protein
MAYTVQSSLETAGTAAFDKRMYFALRPQLHHDQVATVRPVATHQGGSVQFTLRDELAAATSALTENADLTPVAMGDAPVTVTLVEYGNTINTTAKARGTDYSAVDADAANLIGYNAGISLDTIARDVLVAGTNVKFEGQATQGAITASDTYSAASIREVVAGLRGDNVMPFVGTSYLGMIHPDQSVDLRAETGAAGWAEPANNTESSRRWQGIVGVFEGVSWIESPRVKMVTDGGASAVDVYQSLILGQECLAKAFSTSESAALPQVRRGPVVDSLSRFHPVGWYWLGGYARFREAAIRRYETASSIGAN